MSCPLPARGKFSTSGLLCAISSPRKLSSPPTSKKADRPQSWKRHEVNTCLSDRQPHLLCLFPSASLVCARALLGRRRLLSVRFCVAVQKCRGWEEEAEGNSCSQHRSRFPSLTGSKRQSAPGRFPRGPSGWFSSLHSSDWEYFTAALKHEMDQNK